MGIHLIGVALMCVVVLHCLPQQWMAWSLHDGQHLAKRYVQASLCNGSCVYVKGLWLLVKVREGFVVCGGGGRLWLWWPNFSTGRYLFIKWILEAKQT